uniref:Uncharacterized protein n=1 Tax=Arundo donax TaxID=35708 RepID=A0A0A8XTG6_ARUDO
MCASSQSLLRERGSGRRRYNG